MNRHCEGTNQMESNDSGMEAAMRRFNLRDLVASVVIVFLVGVLAGQWLGVKRASLLATEARAAEPPAAGQSVTDLRRSGDSFASIAEKVTPAVVNISSTRTIPGRVWRDPFREFMWGDGLVKEPDRTSQSLGSGVIVDPSGIVVTNNHNIDGADEIRVSLSDSRELKAKLVGRDSWSDVAVLKIDGENLPVAQWGDSDKLRVGDWVVAIGNPFGFNQTVTAGIVSAKGRSDVGVSEVEEFIQTDAAINPGNSGGALVDIDGKLIGINTAIFSKTGGYQGIGFAIPSKVVQANAEQLRRDGRIIRGWIGVDARALTSMIAQQLRLQDTNGAWLGGLYRDQPAHLAGLQRFDTIVAVEGQPILNPRDLRIAISDAKIGSTVTVTYVREGQRHQTKVKITEHPLDQNGDPYAGI